MTIVIQPYNPDWKVEFDRLKHILSIELLEFKIDIQHVGSTSVPGLYAKPILDIDIIISDKAQLADISAKLENVGYLSKGEQGISGRFAFRQSSDRTPWTDRNEKWYEHHLYACFSDSLALQNHLRFRDLLLQDRRLVKEYSQLKINLINQNNMTREKYTKLKTDFIVNALAGDGLDETELHEIKLANMEQNHNE